MRVRRPPCGAAESQSSVPLPMRSTPPRTGRRGGTSSWPKDGRLGSRPLPESPKTPHSPTASRGRRLRPLGTMLGSDASTLRRFPQPDGAGVRRGTRAAGQAGASPAGHGRAQAGPLADPVDGGALSTDDEAAPGREAAAEPRVVEERDAGRRAVCADERRASSTAPATIPPYLFVSCPADRSRTDKQGADLHPAARSRQFTTAPRHSPGAR